MTVNCAFRLTEGKGQIDIPFLMDEKNGIGLRWTAVHPGERGRRQRADSEISLFVERTGGRGKWEKHLP